MNACSVPVARLGRIGPVLGAGAQGTVHALEDHPGWLYKRYLDDVKVDVDGLCALVEWRKRLSAREGRMIDVRTCWPVYVVEGASEIGVVVRHAPAPFMRVVEGQRIALDLQFAYFETARWASVEPVSPRGAVTIVYRLAQVVAVLHRKGAIYGDLSHTNVLWSGASARPGVFLIDCDAAWVTASPRALASGQTPLWADPWPSDGSPLGEQRRDLYKLALAFLRLYYHSTLDLDATTTAVKLPGDPPISRRIRGLLEAGLSGDVGRRPAAHDWLAPLLRFERVLAAEGVG